MGAGTEGGVGGGRRLGPYSARAKPFFPSCDCGGALARQARAGHAPGIFFDPCPTGDPLGGALSAVCAQCNNFDV